MMYSITIFNNIIAILSFILNLTFIYTLSKKAYNYFTNKRYVKYILGFTNDVVQIKHSTFDLKELSGVSNVFITYSSLKSINNIINLLNIINKEFDLIDIGNEYKNEINIGGFMTNKSVNAYFAKHFNQFKYVTNIKYKDAYDKYPIDKQIIEYSSDKFGFKINDTDFLETTSKISDYAFLIKLTKSDFKDDNEKTVHIIFGGTDIGTIKASEYLYTHCKQLYRVYGKKHYAFALEINRIDGSINYSKGRIELTDKMFLK